MNPTNYQPPADEQQARGSISTRPTVGSLAQRPQPTQSLKQQPQPQKELLGHADFNTTMIYTHMLNKGPMDIKSPVDLL